jgi:hypothetical protein
LGVPRPLFSSDDSWNLPDQIACAKLLRAPINNSREDTSMKKTIYAVLTAGALACAMSMPAVAQDKDDKMKMGEKHEKMERHPEIQAAIRHLQQAKNNLEHANHDFGGHRVKAIEHVNQALEELNQALNYDKK